MSVESPPVSSYARRGVEARAQRWLRRPTGSRIARTALWLCVAVAMGYGAYFLMYMQFATYDDTGDWTIGVWSFMHHGSLYASTYGIAGPFYYEFWAAVYGVSGIRLDPDSAAFMSLIAWIAASLLIGLAIQTLTRRILLGLLAALAAFILLEVNMAEALEPAHLSYVLVGILLVGICAWPRLGERARMRAAATAGAICAAVVLTKVNVGALVVCGLCFAVAIYWPGRRVRLILRPLACIALLLVPYALMRTGLQGVTLPFFRGLFILIEVSLLGLVALALPTELGHEPFKRRELLVGAVAAVVTVVVIWVVVVAAGTPPLRLITQGIFGQADLIKWFSADPPFPGGAITLAEYSTGLAIVFAALSSRWAGHYGRLVIDSLPVALLRLVAGFWVLLTCIPYWHYGFTKPIWFASFAVAVPLCWVAGLSRGADEQPEWRFVRMLIATIGCLGCLEVYPVAGSQEGWASLLLVPVALVCVWDGLEMLRARRTPLGLAFRALAWLGVIAAGAFLVARQAWPAMRAGNQAYLAGVSPAVPGGSAYRLPAQFAESLRRTTQVVNHRCKTFVTSPGLYSFYFFTRKAPPTGLNVNEWRKTLSAAQQRAIIHSIEPIPRLCVISSEAVNAFWYPAPFPVPSSPLYRYIRSNFVPVATNWIYTVEVRRSAHPTSRG